MKKCTKYYEKYKTKCIKTCLKIELILLKANNRLKKQKRDIVEKVRSYKVKHKEVINKIRHYSKLLRHYDLYLNYYDMLIRKYIVKKKHI